jgi:hypothetical protein
MKKSPTRLSPSLEDPADLQKLIDELMKDHPNQAVIRKMMLGQGIPYSTDLRTQMGTVLSLMDQGLGAKRMRKSEREL